MIACARKLIAAALAALAGLSGAAAQEAPGDVISATLLTGWRTETGTRMAGLRLRLAPGWKTYWRAPGDAGIPPRFDWSDSDNLADAEVHFPRPEMFRVGGMRTLGYAREVVWPVEITPERPGRTVALRGDIALGVCREVCVPTRLHLAERLPASGSGADTAAIRAALARRPAPAEAAGVGDVTCRLEPIADGLRLTARIESPRLGQDEMVVVEPGDPELWASPSELTREGGTLIAAADLVAPGGGAVALDRSALRVTVLGGANAVTIEGCPAG